MRLKAIRLQGFKSFVDPTYLPLDSNLTAVVGPNGCGKSNIIDAVRWVMGESSVKALRGENMADVIFNGSSGRKALSFCSVELIFDNTDFSLTGQFAQFAEVSIKRKVTRDGGSQYFLNATKCRRKDVVDLFLGTGLGPRSYAIIEQGMINRLIEAKPEELRLFIEEAAGISKYKERRKETSQKMARTLDNLARLQDIQQELDRQCQLLHRQAEQAHRWQSLKSRERMLMQWLYASQWRQLAEQLGASEKQQQLCEQDLSLLANQELQVQTEFEQLDLDQQQAQQQWQRAQQRLFQQQNSIEKLQQALDFSRQQQLLLDTDQQQLEAQRQKLEQSLLADQQQLEQLQEQDPGQQGQLLAQRKSQALARSSSYREQWQQAQQQQLVQQQTLGQAQAKEAALRARLQALQAQRMQIQARLAQAGGHGSNIDPSALEQLELQYQQALDQHQQFEQQWQQQEQRSQSIQQQLQHKQQRLAQQQKQFQEWQQRHDRLEAKLDALGSEDKDWLAKQGLNRFPQLGPELQLLDDTWQSAFDSWLQTWSQARLASPEHWQQPWQQNSKASRWYWPRPQSVESQQHLTLADVVQADDSLRPLMSQVMLVTELEQALSLIPELNDQQWIITAQGVQLGKAWLYWPGTLASWSQTEANHREAKAQLEQLDELLFELETEVEHLQLQWQQLSSKRTALQQQWQQSQQDLQQLEVSWRQLQTRYQAEQDQQQQQLQQRQDQLDELEELADAIFELEEQLEALGEQDMPVLDLAPELQSLQLALAEVEYEADQAREAWQQWQLWQQQWQQQQKSLAQQIQRTQQQCHELEARQEQLLARHHSVKDDQGQSLQEQLDQEQQLLVELQRRAQHQEQALVELQSRRSELQQRLHSLQQQSVSAREQLSQSQLQLGLLQEKRQELTVKISEQNWQLSSLLENMPDQDQSDSWQQELVQIRRQLSDLGTVNLMAIEDYQQALARQQHLQQQCEQLQQALQILNQAIARIDQETKSRFQATFEAVNAGFSELFPLVFAGGKAHLQLLEQDLLVSGLSIMAQPPGKKNSTIHLLSGGEKALTAIALVFAIFRLNPAPFCLLDEVDAPLDEANVVRYAELVARMSEHLQFIFITHNKAAMERAKVLMGVTMNEPGVSRLVSVDLQQAVALGGH